MSTKLGAITKGVIFKRYKMTRLQTEVEFQYGGGFSETGSSNI